MDQHAYCLITTFPWRLQLVLKPAMGGGVSPVQRKRCFDRPGLSCMIVGARPPKAHAYHTTYRHMVQSSCTTQVLRHTDRLGQSSCTTQDLLTYRQICRVLQYYSWLRHTCRLTQSFCTTCFCDTPEENTFFVAFKMLSLKIVTVHQMQICKYVRTHDTDSSTNMYSLAHT